MGFLCWYFGAMVLVAAFFAFRDAIRDLFIRGNLRQYRLTYAPGLCKKCGYDIRACKNVCSECGQPLDTPKPPPRKLL